MTFLKSVSTQKTNHPMKIQPFNLLCAAIAMLLSTAAASRADYQGTVLADGPIAYYPLDLGMDTNGYATDLSGHGNNGSYINIYPGFNDAAGPSAYITSGVAFD